MKRLKVKAGTLSVLAMMLGLLVATPAAQAGSPIVWNHTGGYIPQYYLPNQNYSNVKSWLPNSSHFYMTCWLDNSSAWYYGNYWSDRWFGGWGSTGWWGYVPASYVYYQVWVPHC